MPRDYADSQAHNAIPDEFLWCIITRRHHFPPPAHEQKVRLTFGDGSAETLDVFESVSTCGLCSTSRTLWRDQAEEKFLHATYDYPDGYLAPEGAQWDRVQCRRVWRARHPVTGRARVVKRG